MAVALLCRLFSNLIWMINIDLFNYSTHKHILNIDTAAVFELAQEEELLKICDEMWDSNS